MSVVAETIGCLVMGAGLVWITGVVFYGGCYLAARLIDRMNDKRQ